MAFTIGLIACLILLLGIHLVGAGIRHPKILLTLCIIVGALYWQANSQLEEDISKVTVTAHSSIWCPSDQVSLRIQNNSLQRITEVGLLLNGFRPNHSDVTVSEYVKTDRIIEPGQHWDACWHVGDLYYVPDHVRSTLLWKTEVTSVRMESAE